MRAFVAVAVPELGSLPGLPEAPDRAPRHCTLRFLGEVDEGTVRAVGAALGAVAPQLRSFELSLSGIGAFPDRKRPRVVYARVASGRSELEALAAAVTGSIEPLGLPKDPRPFLPHVTLLRIRSSADGERARRLADAAGDRVLAEARVEELLLMQSELLPSGARHQCVGRYPLTATG
ncbi:MAG: RNA 2',3'-cyclic phosphodiesterase [Thermoplasmata archaeon]|nr:RNA 2',3'-cyclic phosphodiesterase [Thermoplasmata archaeon]